MAMRQRGSLLNSSEILVRMACHPIHVEAPEELAKAAFLVWIMAQPDPLNTRQSASLLIGKHCDTDHPVVQEFLALLRQTLRPPQRRRPRRQRLI